MDNICSSASGVSKSFIFVEVVLFKNSQINLLYGIQHRMSLNLTKISFGGTKFISELNPIRNNICMKCERSGCGSHAVCQRCGTWFLGQDGKLVERAEQVIHAGTRQQHLQYLMLWLRKYNY